MNPSVLTAKDREWFYILDGRPQGPLSQEDLVHIFTSCTLPWNTPIWADGLSAWTPAELALDANTQIHSLPAAQNQPRQIGDLDEGSDREAMLSVTRSPGGKRLQASPSSTVDTASRAIAGRMRALVTHHAALIRVGGLILVVILTTFVGRHLSNHESKTASAWRSRADAHSSLKEAQEERGARFHARDDGPIIPFSWKSWGSRDDLDRLMQGVGFERNGPPEEYAQSYRNYLSRSPRVLVQVTFATSGKSATAVHINVQRDVVVLRDTLNSLQSIVFDVGENVNRLIAVADLEFALASGGRGRGPMWETARTLQDREAARYTSQTTLSNGRESVRIYATRDDLLDAGVLQPTAESIGGYISLEAVR